MAWLTENWLWIVVLLGVLVLLPRVRQLNQEEERAQPGRRPHEGC